MLRDSKLQAFYGKHRDRFIDSYAVTNPSENIPETLAFYALNPATRSTSVVDQKLQFFDAYPELVDLRTHILNSICSVKP